VHAYRTPRPGGCDFLTLDFDPSLLPPGAVLFTSVIEDADLFRRFVRLYRLLAGHASPAARQAAFAAFLTTLIRKTRRPDSPGPAGREPQAVRLVREYLTENYSRKIDLAQLTVLTGLSPFHLTRVFSRETGLPPHAFLSQVRISRAQELLRRRAPISRVAAETGFADQSHLTRTFKTIVGVSPGAYRQSRNLPE
jgi:AraC-like DNA-binding protein